MAPKKTLKNAMVTGPYEYVAILILKKQKPKLMQAKLIKDNL